MSKHENHSNQRDRRRAADADAADGAAAGRPGRRRLISTRAAVPRAGGKPGNPARLRRDSTPQPTTAPDRSGGEDPTMDPTTETSTGQMIASASSLPSTLIAIQRAASDPACDVDKLERLMAMHERFVEREAAAAYTAAMAAMQPELPSVMERGKIKDRSGNVQSTYALWEDINAAVKPILQKNGFALSFRTKTSDGSVTVVGILAHNMGHREETEITLPADTSGSKNSVQSVGSSVSYGKRYTASALLNLTTHGEDDDGRLGGGKLSAEDLDWIDRANHVEHPSEYQELRTTMLESYGGAAKVPREVREAFNRAKVRTTPKD